MTNAFLTKVIKFISITLVAYCTIELMSIADGDANIVKEYSCAFGSWLPEKHTIYAKTWKEANHALHLVDPWDITGIYCLINE